LRSNENLLGDCGGVFFVSEGCAYMGFEWVGFVVRVLTWILRFWYCFFWLFWGCFVGARFAWVGWFLAWFGFGCFGFFVFCVYVWFGFCCASGFVWLWFAV
jgi:hypothetical protein